MRYGLTILCLLLGVMLSSPAYAVGSCGGVSDSCQCGMSNPYPCCNNGNGKSSNCTWGAWHMACCGWGKGLPGWSHAKFWAGNANAHPDYQVHGSPQKDAIACRDSGTYGHVAWVTSVNGGSIKVHEQSCCEGAACWPSCSYCINGFADTNYQASYYTGGFIKPKGGEVTPYCGDGKCNNGENCSSCSKDCGGCCGNGKCDNGENCSSCSKDCGDCCGNGKCDNGETCSSCEKDCGKCCGNGKCDNGEDCASCEKDCGICNDPPEGKIEVLNCREISGWALDPDVDWPIAIRIRKDGDLVQELTANGAHAKKDGHGFHLDLPADWKDGQAHTLEIIGMDDKDLDNKAISGSGGQVLCQTASTTRGIWNLEFFEAAGVDILPVNGDGGWTELQLRHPGNLPYANAGSVVAGAHISTSPFEQVSGQLCGALAAGLYLANVTVAGEPVAMLSGDGPCTPFVWTATGTELAASLTALEMANDSTERVCSLRDLAFQSRGWLLGYSGDSSGMIWGAESADRMTFEMRPGAAACTGFVGVERAFQHPFEGVTLKTDLFAAGGPAMTIAFGDDEPLPLSDCVVAGACTIEGLDAHRLAIAAECGPGTDVPETWQQVLDGIRVFRSVEEDLHPWLVVGKRVWGLAAQMPFTATNGLTLRISTAASDFVPFGALAGTTVWPAPPIDEVRGMLSYSLPGECYQGFLTMDDVPVQTATFGDYAGPFTLKRTGTSFGLALTAQDGCAMDGAGGLMEVSNVSVKRGGWWTTPSPTFAGIKDGRSEAGCGLLFENQKWWGMSEKEAQGSLLVHRYLDGEYEGIRYRVRHTFEGPFFRLGLLLDGKPAKDYSLQKPSEWTEEVLGKQFGEVGFAFGVATKGVYPFKWQLFLEDVELYSPGAGWVSACEALEAEPELEGVLEVSGEDVTALPDQGPGHGSPAGGCGVHPFPAPIWLLPLMLLVLFALGRRRTD